ncbi:MAG: citrate/2-methylcitrate synthase [Syntrophomonadaceae bacterium]|jgi:citrate synthase|nr:citrate/2-methylcitrate synthase [Syntrophomonadaceae bacterium]
MASTINYSEVTPKIKYLAEMCSSSIIPAELYSEFKVNRGLRDIKGNGVLTGLTNIAQVTAKKMVDEVEMPMEGKLYYHGIDIEDIVSGFVKEKRFGYEETVYLLLFGSLPNAQELNDFNAILSEYRSLPPKFTRDFILKAPSSDMMNALARSVLMLYYYDNNPEDNSIPNVLRQCLQLVARLPMLAVYGYHAYNHYEKDNSLIIHQPSPSLSTAENVLHMLRSDQRFSDFEARIFDLALVLHAEHGGGNNSTFTVRVVSSSGTDTYSAIAAGLGSLKGIKHGGANIMVAKMMQNIKQNVKNWDDEDEVAAYLKKILRKDAFDRAGLIYGIGHAIYSLSDPRAKIFETFVKKLSSIKNREPEYRLYSSVARLAPKIIQEERKMYKGVSANIDFYSGFVYQMLGLPIELITPIFAISRIAGWSAHRIEELVNSSKIVRPAYNCVAERRKYIPLVER